MAGDGSNSDVVRRDRFSGGPARGFLSSLADDERIFGADLVVDRAHVVMLADRGIVDAEAAGAILDALDAVETAGFDALPAGEDVHAAIETAVIHRAGPVGGWMHTARSRNDEIAACLRYRLRGDLLRAIEAVTDLRGTVLDAARKHRETVMPGYTHLQPAQPTTLAHWLLSYESPARRATARLVDAYDRTNRSPLGAAAFAGTPFPIDRERTATLLGFDGVLENSADAVSTRDFLVESAAALASLAFDLSSLAEDVILFAHRGDVELADEFASTSSIMPQKKNPDSLELVRATTGDAAAGLIGLLTTVKGLPRAYNRDLQAATPHAWAAVDAVVAATRVVDGAVGTADWATDRLAAEADAGFSTATGVADALAMAGIPFRTAHEIVATAADSGADLDALEAATKAVLGESLADVADADLVAAALDPAESVRMRDSTGGPAPAAVDSAVASAAAALETDREATAARRGALEAAADRLDAAVEGYR